MVDDAKTQLLERYTLEEVNEMDAFDFAEAYSSIKRVEARERFWEINKDILTTHPSKKNKIDVSPLQKNLETWIPTVELRQSMGTIQDLAKRGSMDK